MAEQEFNLSDNAIAIFTSRPEVIVRHSISDEELDILCSGSDSARSQVVSVAIGALAGSIPSAVPGFVRLFQGKPQDVVTLTQCAIAVGALVAICVVLYATKGQKTKSRSLLSKIRARGPSTH